MNRDKEQEHPLKTRGSTAIRATITLVVLLLSAGRIFASGIWELASTGTPQAVQEALRQPGADVNARYTIGRTLLMAAAQSNPDPEVITTLLKAGADVNAKDEAGDTALMWAARQNPNASGISRLAQAGADVNAKDNAGDTALILAAYSNPSSEVVATLLRAGADVNAKDNAGDTALILACRPWTPPRSIAAEVVSLLLTAGADVNVKDNNGATAFLTAQENSDLKKTAAYQRLAAAAQSAKPSSVAVTPVAPPVKIQPLNEKGGARFALVIGNGAYTHVTKLTNPTNDAQDMADELKSLGFKVDLLVNADISAMENAVVRLGNQLSNSADAVGFFYYAGHGVQSSGANYLIPTEADIPSASFLQQKSLALQSVLDTMQSSSNKLNVVVLDACRDNPFSWSRSGTRGFTVVNAQPPASIIVYATSAGSVAKDGLGRNGVFTGELLRHLNAPGVDIADVFRQTGAAVRDETGGSQIPAIYSQFFDPFFLSGSSNQ
ncbi:MAG: caspase family protein [Spirochaetia bacterium]